MLSSDIVTETSTLATEIDIVYSSVNYKLGTNIEDLTLTGNVKINATGNALNNFLIGNSSNNIINGNSGNDTIIGGLGEDHLTGGNGSDIFKLVSISETGVTATTEDTIVDFNSNQGDKIDLSAIDADIATPENQPFIFIGNQPFSTTNASTQLRFNSTTHILSGSVNLDNKPEFSIQLNGIINLSQGDFVF